MTLVHFNQKILNSYRCKTDKISLLFNRNTLGRLKGREKKYLINFLWPLQ